MGVSRFALVCPEPELDTLPGRAAPRKARRSNGSGDEVKSAFAVLEEIGLNETSDVSAVIDRVAADYFGAGQPKLTECVQLAQIAAKLGVTIGKSFRYATADRKLRATSKIILFDEDGALEELLPEAMRLTQLLSAEYTSNFTSCSNDEWKNWVNSGRSGLETFVPFVAMSTNEYSRVRIAAEARNRGLKGELSYPYKTDHFRIVDWDFDAAIWRYWEAQAKSDENVWARVAGRILGQRESFWTRHSSAQFFQIATTGSARSMTYATLRPKWVQRLSEKRCLPDTRGLLHIPEYLLRRTPETESLIDVSHSSPRFSIAKLPDRYWKHRGFAVCQRGQVSWSIDCEHCQNPTRLLRMRSKMVSAS